MGLKHILVLVFFVLVGVVFANSIRKLPGISMLPAY